MLFLMRNCGVSGSYKDFSFKLCRVFPPSLLPGSASGAACHPQWAPRGLLFSSGDSAQIRLLSRLCHGRFRPCQMLPLQRHGPVVWPRYHMQRCVLCTTYLHALRLTPPLTFPPPFQPYVAVIPIPLRTGTLSENVRLSAVAYPTNVGQAMN